MAAICLGCAKNDLPDVPNGANNGTPETVQDTLCMYQNIVLDTWDLHSIEGNDLLGRWKLITYGDLESCTFSDNPQNTDESWEIEFYDWILVRIKALAYSFYGIYNFQYDFLEFGAFGGRSVEAPPDLKWGIELLNALHLNGDLVTIKNDTLLIYYSQSSEVMILARE